MISYDIAMMSKQRNTLGVAQEPMRVTLESKRVSDNPFFEWGSLLWTAPEVLWALRTDTYSDPVGSKEADIYSLGIILHVIICVCTL